MWLKAYLKSGVWIIIFIAIIIFLKQDELPFSNSQKEKKKKKSQNENPPTVKWEFLLLIISLKAVLLHLWLQILFSSLLIADCWCQ